MTVHVFAGDGRPGPYFDRLSRSTKHDLVAHDIEVFRRFRAIEGDLVVYLDLGSLSDAEARGMLKSLLRKRLDFPVGVVDPAGTVEDPGLLFHRGVADYVGPAVAASGIATNRIDQMRSYVESRTSPADEQDAEEQRAAPSLWQRARQRARQWAKGDVKPAGSWSEVQSAQEYTFWLLFCELDHADSYRRTMSEAQAQALFERFRSAVLREIQRVSGREWMWKEVGGVLLFPFDGRDHGPALAGLRMVLNRVIINVEDFAIRSPISFRLALHVGNTVYRDKGETGTIVSDAVNYLFHLGERFTRPGCFTITETAAAYLPHTLESYFLREGEYEGREIFRMREPVAPV